MSSEAGGRRQLLDQEVVGVSSCMFTSWFSVRRAQTFRPPGWQGSKDDCSANILAAPARACVCTTAEMFIYTIARIPLWFSFQITKIWQDGRHACL